MSETNDPKDQKLRKHSLEKFFNGEHKIDGDYVRVETWLLYDHVDVGGRQLPSIALYERAKAGQFASIKQPEDPYSLLALSAREEVWVHTKDLRTLRIYIEALFLQGSPLVRELPLEEQTKLIRNTAIQVVDDIFAEPTRENIERGTKVVSSMVYTIMRDPNAYFLVSQLSSHDPYTLQHSVGTAVNAIILAKRMGLNTEEELCEAGIAGLLHDIGKVKVRAELINKHGALEEHEWEEMRSHAIEGYNIVKDDPNVPEKAKLAILEHHEDKNGTGYPKRKKLSELGLLSRIVCVSDIFNALTTDRTYSKARSVFDALQFMHTQLAHKIDDEVFKELVILYKG